MTDCISNESGAWAGDPAGERFRPVDQLGGVARGSMGYCA